jgi:type I restriction enzyme, S subunit
VRRGEAIKRTDPYFHQPEFRTLEKKLLKSKFIKNLRDVATSFTNGDHGGLDYLDSGVRYLRGQSIMEYGLDLEKDPLYISLEDHKRMERAEVIPGDVVLTIAGSIGNSCVIKGVERANINQAIVKIRPSEEINSDYLAIFLNSHLGKFQTERLANGAVQLNVNFSETGDIKIIVPSLDIQRTLVADMESARLMRQEKLSQADELLKGIDGFVLEQLGIKLPRAMSLRDGESVEAISANQKGIASQKALATTGRKAFAIRFNAVQAGRVDPHFHHPSFAKLIEVIKTVPYKELGQLVKFSDEVWSPEKETAETFKYIEISGVELQTGNITATETLVSEAASRARMVTRNGDILISLTRPHRGAIAQADQSLDGCIASTGFSIIREITDKRIAKDYLWCILRNQVSLQQMLQRSSGGNYPAITETELQKILIPIPSEKIQEKISSELSRRRTQARALREEAEREWQAAKENFEKALLG